jgi:HK97 family phage portal protein
MLPTLADIAALVGKARSVANRMDASFVRATVTTADETRGQFARERSLHEQLHRARQWVWICAAVNARCCAGQRLRLMRKPRSVKRAGKGWRRVEDRERLKYLREVHGKAGVYANETDDIEEVTEHPILDLIRRPRAGMTGYAYNVARFMDLELCGNALTQIVDVGGQPGQLYRLNPMWWSVIPDRTDFIRGYRYGRDGHNQTTFDADECLHQVHMPSLWSPYLGMSWVHAVILDADRFAASTENDLYMWRNSARPDWHLSLPEGSGEVQVAQAREQIKAMLGGPRNTHGFLVTTGTEPKPLAFTPRDLEGVASRKDAREIIHAAAGVPMTFTELSDSNKAGSTTGSTQYLRYTIAPRLTQDQDEHTDNLLSRFPGTEGWWFVYDNPVPEDELAMVERHVKLVNIGRMTLNESRLEDGYEAYEESVGDVPRFNGVPLDMMGIQQPMGDASGIMSPEMEQPEEGAVPPGVDVQATALNGAQVTSLQEMLQAVADGTLPLESVRAAISAAFPTLSEEQVSAMVAPLMNFEPVKPEPVAPPAAPPVAKSARAMMHTKGSSACCGPSHHKDDRLGATVIQATEKELERLLRGFFQGIDSGQLVPETGIYQRISANQGLVDAFLSVTRDPLGKLYLNGWNAGVVDLSGREGGGVPLQAMTGPVTEYLTKFQGRLQRSVFETVDSRLGSAIAEGIEAGEAIPLIRNRVQAELGGIAQHSAENIARTETSRAYLNARESAWQEVGGVKSKEWLLSADPCPICQTMADRHRTAPVGEPFMKRGQTIGLVGGGTFTNDYADMDTPPAHPQCRCSMGAIFEDDE